MKNKDNAIKKLNLEAIKKGFLPENSGRSDGTKIIYKIKLENKTNEDGFFCVASSDFFDNVKQALHYLRNKPLTEERQEILYNNN